MKVTIRRKGGNVTVTSESRAKEPSGSGRSSVSMTVAGTKLKFSSQGGSVWMNSAAKKAIQQAKPKRLESGVRVRTKEEVLKDLETRSKKRFG